MNGRAYLYWVDAYGGERLTWYTYASGPLSVLFQEALQAVANPIPSTLVYGAVNVYVGPPASTDPYLAVTDSAVLTFATATGNKIGLVVPGFKESLYLGDNQTVDVAQPLIIALIAQVIGYLVDSGGNVATAFVSGLRQRRGY